MTENERKEVYDLVNEHDEVQGQGTYEDARARNLFTRSVHILLFDQNGRLLVCKRALTKRSYPGVITSSAGGHVEVGETYRVAASRELQEELTINVPLRDHGRFDVITEKERTIHHLFIGTITKQEIRSLKFDPTEVASHRFKTSKSLARDIARNPHRYAPPFREALSCYLRPKTYVIDFDHTLFDWYKYKADFAHRIEKAFGIPPHQFDETRDTYRKQHDGRYHIDGHLELLAKTSDISSEKLASVHTSFARKGHRYVFPDARTFLKRIKSEKAHLVLLSYGDEENQQFFFKTTGVLAHFSEVHVVQKQEEKVAVVREVAKKCDGVCIIVNDNPHEAFLMAPQLSPTTWSYLIERPRTKYPEIEPHEDYTVVHSLREIP